MLAKILLPVALVAGAASFAFGEYESAADFGFYGRSGLFVVVFLVGTAAGSAVQRLRLDGVDITVGSTLRTMASHWLSFMVSLVLGVATVVMTLIGLGSITQNTVVLVVFLVPLSVVVGQLISLGLVATVVWSGEAGWVRRLLHISAGKLFGVGCLWSAAIVIFSALVVAWQVILLAFFLDSALAPLGIDLEQWQSASRGFILLLPAAVLLGPGAGGVWTLALLDESVRKTGLDLTYQARAMAGSDV